MGEREGEGGSDKIRRSARSVCILYIYISIILTVSLPLSISFFSSYRPELGIVVQECGEFLLTASQVQADKIRQSLEKDPRMLDYTFVDIFTKFESSIRRIFKKVSFFSSLLFYSLLVSSLLFSSLLFSSLLFSSLLNSSNCILGVLVNAVSTSEAHRPTQYRPYFQI